MYCIKCSDMIVCVFVQHEQSCEQLCAALSSEASAIQKLQAAEESKARLLAAAEESQASMTQQLQAAEDSAASAKQQLDESLKSNIAATKRAESCALTARFVAEAANEAAKQLNDEVEELRNAVLRLHDRVRVADEHAAAAHRQLELKIVSNRSQGGALKQLHTALAEAEAARRTAEESTRLAQENLAVYQRQLAEAEASGDAAAEAAIRVAEAASALAEKDKVLQLQDQALLQLEAERGRLGAEVELLQQSLKDSNEEAAARIQRLNVSDGEATAARAQVCAVQAQLEELRRRAPAERVDFGQQFNLLEDALGLQPSPTEDEQPDMVQLLLSLHPVDGMCLCMCLSTLCTIGVYACRYPCLHACLHTCLYARLNTCLHRCLYYACLHTIHMSIRMAIHMSIHRPIHMSIHMSIHTC